MNNCLEKAHFIAHTLHETASYSLLEEGLGGNLKAQYMMAIRDVD